MIKEMILPDLVLPFVILGASLFFVFRLFPFQEAECKQSHHPDIDSKRGKE